MYCSYCATPIAPGTSFCNRCGASLTARTESKKGSVNAFLTAITLIGVIGLGIMLGGALTLKTDANLTEELVGIFMLFTFLIVAITEILLVRQLSRLTSSKERQTVEFYPPPVTGEIRAAQPRALVEPLPSVTENTTRTLEYAPNEPMR